MLMLAGIDDPKLDSAASHPSSSSCSLPRRVVCHPGHPARADYYGWSGSTAPVHMLCLLLLLLSDWSAVGFGYAYGHK